MNSSLILRSSVILAISALVSDRSASITSNSNIFHVIPLDVGQKVARPFCAPVPFSGYKFPMNNIAAQMCIHKLKRTAHQLDDACRLIVSSFLANFIRTAVSFYM